MTTIHKCSVGKIGQLNKLMWSKLSLKNFNDLFLLNWPVLRDHCALGYYTKLTAFYRDCRASPIQCHTELVFPLEAENTEASSNHSSDIFKTKKKEP